MNSILIVLPILTLLMFCLGLTLEAKDFLFVLKRSKAVAIGLFGQLFMPLLAWIVALSLHLDPIFTIGLVLIACCPGGSSSNIFSMLAKGDVALSVSLTALSSIITLFSLPLIMQLVTSAVGHQVGIQLPIKNLLMQNLVTMLLPILIGIVIRYYKPDLAARIAKMLSKLAFPALMLLAGIFFVQHKETIISNFRVLGIAVTMLLLVAISFAGLLGYITNLRTTEQRTIIIEVGMQNAAQAIAIASSPFVFNDSRFAIPAILYALMMNVVLLTYVGGLKMKK
jgi:BASS family bile acid:Na+ symporter